MAVAVGTEFKSYFENINEKIKHVDKNIEELLTFLDNNRDVEIKDDSKVKIFFKSSTIHYRYYYILDDSYFNKILNTIKEGKMLSPTIFDVDSKSMSSISNKITNAKSIQELIDIAVVYRKRCNTIGNLLKEKKVKGFQAQIMLVGLTDLNIQIKRIVNLNK